MQLQPDDTISTWLQDPLLKEQGFLQVSVRSIDGKSITKLFNAPTAKIHPHPAQTLELEQTMQQFSRDGGYTFVGQEYNTAKLGHHSLSKLFLLKGRLPAELKNLGEYSSGLGYLPDLDYTQDMANALRLPWPPLLSRLQHKPISSQFFPS
ncbi:MAG: hypothetical protein M1829_001473 [Trizodia sp. TS-e1964]|nr:MAG: hypothetical protein M1829_001473 [Trizodia sp. TS-e1964]